MTQDENTNAMENNNSKRRSTTRDTKIQKWRFAWCSSLFISNCASSDSPSVNKVVVSSLARCGITRFFTADPVEEPSSFAPESFLASTSGSVSPPLRFFVFMLFLGCPVLMHKQRAK